MAIEEKVVEFFSSLFDRMFTKAFSPKLKQPLRRRAVERQIEEAADAASRSLTRLFINRRTSLKAAQNTLKACKAVLSKVSIEDVSSPNLTPEAFIQKNRRPSGSASEAVFVEDPVARAGLHSVVQVLMLVAPVMNEWRKLEFSSQFELPRRVVNRLNEISEQLSALGSGGTDAGDDAFELTYRDYLLQRFHRVEAGTVRMTTNLAVDLQSLFVMARLSSPSDCEALPDAFMGLSQARKLLLKEPGEKAPQATEASTDAWEEIRKHPRCVIVGTPGGGKSTLLEWLQLQLASVNEMLVMGSGQAIPLLIRVRTLDPTALPVGNGLIEKATGSSDQAALCPAGWVDRMMQAGRVVFMVDGLDEVDPTHRDQFVLPWLTKLSQDFPSCRYIVSSRPSGYAAGTLTELGFVERTLCDFEEAEVKAFAENWCTAVRLARNEREEEAKREGIKDGAAIVASFRDNSYVRNLARNPLMLSAICLVHYFEGGELPKDRAILYRLCVEGLLHHWDQRRGIRSEFGLDEKLRVCREVAIAMQNSDRAEFEEARVLSVLRKSLGEAARAKKLLAHIRHRTGLLLERRANVYAFAHLTFQEYLAALALDAGNLEKVEAKQVVKSLDDGRWQEVLALYSAIASTKDVRSILRLLMKSPDSERLSLVLGEVFLAAPKELASDLVLQKQVVDRLARCSSNEMLSRFPDSAVVEAAHDALGSVSAIRGASEAYFWLAKHRQQIRWPQVISKIRDVPDPVAGDLTEIVFLTHLLGPDEALASPDSERVYLMAGIGPAYPSQASLAYQALVLRQEWGQHACNTLLSLLRLFLNQPRLFGSAFSFGRERPARQIPSPFRAEAADLMRQLARLVEPSQRDGLLEAASIFTQDTNAKSHAV